MAVRNTAPKPQTLPRREQAALPSGAVLGWWLLSELGALAQPSACTLLARGARAGEKMPGAAGAHTADGDTAGCFTSVGARDFYNLDIFFLSRKLVTKG